jgi:sugar/nucleoside kinase (ribokinase family)
MKKILGIGNALVDILTIIDDDKILEDFDLPKGSMQLVDAKKSELVKSGTTKYERIWSSGGSAANTIHGLAMLGLNTRFIGSVGKDEAGDLFKSEMQKAGVDTILLRKDSQTGTAVTLISPDSERTFATHLGAATEISSDDLSIDYFRDYDILYLEGYLINDFGFIETACRMAKDADMTIALDLASYNVVEYNLNSFESIINGFVNILFANELEAKAYTGLDPLQALPRISSSVDIAVLKTGAEGSVISDHGNLLRIDPYPVKCNDTTGAGDLYASGFLFAYANGFDMSLCGKIGSLLAARVIEIVGARMDDRTFAGIRKEIRKMTGTK